MKMYLIAIVIAFIGLWVSSEVRASDLCTPRSGGVFSVEDWKAQGTKGAVDFTVTLRSKDKKPIRAVGGTVQFLLDGKRLAEFQISFKAPAEALGTTAVQATQRRTADAERLLAAEHGTIKALACVDHVEYIDGSGVIIN